MEFVILVFLFIGSTLSQKVDKCPKIKTQPSFDVEQFVGKWYEISRVEEPSRKCIKYDVTLDDDRHITCLNQGIDQKSEKNTTEKWYGQVTKPEAKITFLRATFPIQKIKSFWILDSDYISYAVLWSCDSDMQSKKYTWILTRDQHPSDDIIEKSYKVVSQYGITKEMFKRIDQTNC